MNYVYIYDKKYIWIYKNKVVNKNLVVTVKNTKETLLLTEMIAKRG